MRFASSLCVHFQLFSFYGWKSVNIPQEYISRAVRAVMSMTSLLSNPAASPVDNSINVENKTSETTEYPADTELETSLEPINHQLGKDLSRNCLLWHRRILQCRHNSLH